ncbi:MAG: TadE/TadG family type IV pilus assembly protein [Candidatus Binataceae bacterium]
MSGSRSPKAKRGQSVLEFALAISVFILVAFAAMQLAYAVYSYNMVCAAAREGVRYAIVHYSGNANLQASLDTEIQRAAIAAAPGLRLRPGDVVLSWPPDPQLPSQTDARVVITYGYNLNIPFMAPVTLTLSSASQMLVSN